MWKNRSLQKKTAKVKDKINQLKISNKEKEDLYKILQLRNSDSSNNEDENFNTNQVRTQLIQK